MRRGVWLAMLAGMVVLVAGVPGCEKQQPPPGTMEPLGPPSGVKPAADAPTQPKEPAPAPVVEPQPEPEPTKPPPEGSVQLRWKLPKEKRMAYRAEYETKPGPAPVKFNAAAIIKAGGMPKPLIAKLNQMSPPGAGALTALLTSTYGNLRIRMIGKDFAEVPEELDGELAARVMGTEAGVEMKGEITDSGKIMSAPSGDDYAVLGLMFELPEGHVLPGDTWKSSVDLLRGGDIEVAKTDEFNQVTLKKLKPMPGGEKLAIIQVAMAQVEEGKRYTAEGEQPVKRWAAFVGRGEMLVKAGRWKTFSGIVQTVDPTAKQKTTHTVLKLSPLPQVPKKFEGLD